MTIDTTPLGALAAEVMGALTEQFGEEFVVRTAAIVVEIDSPKNGHLWARCTDDRPWVLSALLYEATDSIAAIRKDFSERKREDEE